METKELDGILALQLTIARLGEKELCAWWNVDLAYKLGGADFLRRLAGATMAALAAGEGLLQAAAQSEAGIITGIPESVCSLFQPEASVQVELHHRFRHFKAYPTDLPTEIAKLLDAEKDWKIGDLAAHRDALCSGIVMPKMEATAFGRLVSVPAGLGPLETAKALALSFDPRQKGGLLLSYYRNERSA